MRGAEKIALKEGVEGRITSSTGSRNVTKVGAKMDVADGRRV
jgi:hypothetical protein